MANPLSLFFQRLFGSDNQRNTSTTSVASQTSTPAPAIKAATTANPIAASDSSYTPEAVTATATETPPQTTNTSSDNETTLASENDINAVVAPALMVWKPPVAVDALFFDWLMGNPGESSSADNEQELLQALYRLLASDLNDAVIVPRMPSVIPQLLHSLRSKTVSTGELTKHIVKDASLVGEVINTVNSALYNPADRIDNLDNAVMMLGEEGLRLVIAKVAFRPIINLHAGHYTRRAAPLIWAQSEKCAIACHTLTRKESNFDPFHAFLAGLIKNLGLIIAFRLLDQECKQVKFHYSIGFQLAMSSVAATLSYRIAQRWEFPEHVVLALQQQAGGRKAVNWTPLGHLLHTADLISKMRLLVNQAQLKGSDSQLTTGLPPDARLCYTRLNSLQLHDLAGVNPVKMDILP